MIQENTDILTTNNIFETAQERILTRDTDQGQILQQRISDLKALLEAYRSGSISPKNREKSYNP